MGSFYSSPASRGLVLYKTHQQGENPAVQRPLGLRLSRWESPRGHLLMAIATTSEIFLAATRGRSETVTLANKNLSDQQSCVTNLRDAALSW